MYDLYKPFRNFMQQFPLLPSLEIIWAYSEHIFHNMRLPPALQMRSVHGFPIILKDKIYPWEFDLLCREIILNAAPNGPRSLASWKDLSTAINHIRRIENEIAGRADERNILRELHRIIHRQFPWQRPPSVASMMRYMKIFGSGDLDPLVSDVTGLTMKQFYTLGLAAGGHFMKSPGLNTNQEYKEFGIRPEQSAAFYNRLTSDIMTLRAETKAAQRYDDSWAFAFNPLQSRPLVSFDAAHPERVLCPIPIFLLRRVSEGIFYDIAGCEGFGNPFGYAFQHYVGEVLRKVCQQPQFDIFAEEEYQIGKYRKDGVDWILQDATGNVFVECKTKRLRQDAKFIVEGNGLTEALNSMAGYVVQHYKNIVDAINAKTRWQPNGRPIFPIIVTLEEWWLFNPKIIGMLTDQIKIHLAEAQIDLDVLRTMPFTIASIDEFELAVQVIAKTGVAPFLGQKTDEGHREWSLFPFALGQFPEEAKGCHRLLFEDEFMKFGEDLRPRAAV